MALTDAQLPTLKTAIAAETDPTFVQNRNAGATGAMATFYNTNHPTFIVWKTLVALGDIGKAMDGAEAAGLTTANNTRLQVRAAFMASGENPSVAGTRFFYDDVFSTGGVTKAALLVLWKRAAKRGERLYATGTGSDASPGQLVFQGDITNDDVVRALALP